LSFDIFELLLQASLLVKLVLVVLVVFSLVSWTIIATKWVELRRAVEDSEAFLDVYRKESLQDALEAARLLDRSPVAVIFVVGYGEVSALARRASRAARDGSEDEQSHVVERHLAWSANREAQQLERGLTFLATTGSSAPFIGLFGTVVGIIQTFEGIGQAGNASLAVVGPGMAEALIATAAGLLAAIPASIFYNNFIHRMDDIRSTIELFSTEFQSDLVRMVRASEAKAARSSRE
jgi:biopolymer transport protein TolQ